jgi:hypothetical protein
LEWLSALSLSVSQRRPSFQGPSLVGKELNWGYNKGPVE